jgi:hypothetical protein
LIRYAIFALRPAVNGDLLLFNENATFKPGKAQLAADSTFSPYRWLARTSEMMVRKCCR